MENSWGDYLKKHERAEDMLLNRRVRVNGNEMTIEAYEEHQHNQFQGHAHHLVKKLEKVIPKTGNHGMDENHLKIEHVFMQQPTKTRWYVRPSDYQSIVK